MVQMVQEKGESQTQRFVSQTIEHQADFHFTTPFSSNAKLIFSWEHVKSIGNWSSCRRKQRSDHSRPRKVVISRFSVLNGYKYCSHFWTLKRKHCDPPLPNLGVLDRSPSFLELQALSIRVIYHCFIRVTYHWWSIFVNLTVAGDLPASAHKI